MKSFIFDRRTLSVLGLIFLLYVARLLLDHKYYSIPTFGGQSLLWGNIEVIVQGLLITGIIVVASGPLKDPGTFGQRLRQTFCGLLLLLYSFVSFFATNFMYPDVTGANSNDYAIANLSHTLANTVSGIVLIVGIGLIAVAIKRDVNARRTAKLAKNNQVTST